LYNCRRSDDAEVTERLRRLARSILRRCAAEEIVAADPSWKLVGAWPHGDVYALEALWKRVGIDRVIAERQQARRRELRKELEAELASLRDTKGDILSKRLCALLSSARYGRYLQATATGARIHQKAIQEQEHFDGKFVVYSNDDTLTAEDMALGYKQRQRVEEAWRDLKSGPRLRPVFHWAVHRIHAHLAITMLSLLLQRVAEHACNDTWRNIRDDLKRIQLAQWSSPNGTVWQVTEPTADAAKRLKSLTIKAPTPIFGMA
jgi:hypothetical protein